MKRRTLEWNCPALLRVCIKFVIHSIFVKMDRYHIVFVTIVDQCSKDCRPMYSKSLTSVFVQYKYISQRFSVL